MTIVIQQNIPMPKYIYDSYQYKGSYDSNLSSKNDFRAYENFEHGKIKNNLPETRGYIVEKCINNNIIENISKKINIITPELGVGTSQDMDEAWDLLLECLDRPIESFDSPHIESCKVVGRDNTGEPHISNDDIHEAYLPELSNIVLNEGKDNVPLNQECLVMDGAGFEEGSETVPLGLLPPESNSIVLQDGGNENQRPERPENKGLKKPEQEVLNDGETEYFGGDGRYEGMGPRIKDNGVHVGPEEIVYI